MIQFNNKNVRKVKMLGALAILAWIVKAIYKIVKVALYCLANILLYFGLWIPAIYMVICGVLMLTGGINLSIVNVNTILFYVGLGMTLLGSVIISVRNLIVKPIRQMIESERAKKELAERKLEDKKQKLYEKNPIKYFKKYEGGMPHKSHPYYDQSISRKGFYPPKVYRSSNNPSIIIHEYRTHFKVFKEYPNGDFQMIDIKDKPKDFKEGKKGYGKNAR